MNKPQIKKAYIYSEITGELRHGSPIIYDGVYYTLGVINLFSSYQTIPFPL